MDVNSDATAPHRKGARVNLILVTSTEAAIFLGWTNRRKAANLPDTDGNDPAAVPSIDCTDPFNLPEYEWAFYQFVYTAVNSLMRSKNLVLSRISYETSPNIYASRNTTDSGEVVELNPIRTHLEFTIDGNDVVAGKLDSVAETINQAAEEGLGRIMPQIAACVGKMIDAFGTEVRLNGAPFDHAAVRQVAEANEIEFDANGNPDLEAWIFTDPGLQTATTLDGLIRQFPPRTPEETRAWDDMIEQKRQEFNAKRRRRTLS